MKNYLFTAILCFILPYSIQGQLAPDFTITATDGNTYELYNDFLDQGKTVVLKIMFVDCPPCNSIAASTEVLYQDWGGGELDVEFIDVSDKNWDTNADVHSYELMHGLSFLGAGEDGGSVDVANVYKNGVFGTFLGTPTFVVIAPNRQVTYDPRGLSQSSTIAALDLAIEATGAQRPVTTFTIQGLVSTETGQNIENVNLSLGDLNENTNPEGIYSFTEIDDFGDGNLSPFKNDDHDNGINVLDVFILQKHILFIEPLASAYQKVSADLNGNGRINIADLIQMRRLILFFDETIPSNTSWRFVDESFLFENESHSEVEIFPETINLNSPESGQFNFIGMKIGDLNNSASPTGFEIESKDRDEVLFKMYSENFSFEKNQEIRVPIYSKEPGQLNGLQFSLSFNTENLSFTGIEAESLPIAEIDFNSEFREEGIIPFLWADTKGIALQKEEPLFYLLFKSIENGEIQGNLSINSKKTKAMALISEEGILEPFLAKPIFNFTFSNSQLLKNSILSHPNPVINTLKVNFEKKPVGAELVLLDCFGKKLNHISNIDQSKLEIDLSALVTGVYFIQFFENDCLIDTQKIIKAN